MTRKKWFFAGMRAGIPIALGYFAVAIALGVASIDAGILPHVASLTSFLIHSSTGEYIGITLIAAGAGYLEVFLMEAVANARYLLMSCALGQKLSPKATIGERLLLGFGVTDEIFGASISVTGELDPFFSYGAMLVAIPGWALGTLSGALLGSILPESLLSAFSVSLYGMFISVFVPGAKKNKIVALLVAVSLVCSFVFMKLSIFSDIPEGIKIIILTVVISLAAAIIFPIKEEENE